MLIYKLFITIIVFALSSSWASAEVPSEYCAQHGPSAPRLSSVRSSTAIKSEPVTIDYAVFYTPEARETQGGTEAMAARIETAFAGANQRFEQSGVQLIHRVVLVQELPLNNTNTTIPELNNDLARGFNFFEALAASQADSVVIVVKSQRPGGFASIPLSRSRARGGGFINLGLPNLSAGVLAHEIGHTLGSGHDYILPSAQFFDIPPGYGAGNHFIGSTTGICYRTIMSALIDCKVPGHEDKQTVNCERFSSPLLLFDGTPTGDAEYADNARLFADYGPYVGSARGPWQLPEPTPTTDLPSDGEDNDDPGNSVPTPSPTKDKLTLEIRKQSGRNSAQGRCLSHEKIPLTGDSIEIHFQNGKKKKETRVKTLMCTPEGKFATRVSKKGSYRAKNKRTGTATKLVRLR